MADETIALDAEPTPAAVPSVEPDPIPDVPHSPDAVEITALGDTERRYIEPFATVVKDATPLAEPLFTMARLKAWKALEDGRRVYTFLASSDVLDRQGETIDQSGWDLRDYEANPVILDSHQYDSIEHILGRSVGLRLTDKGLEADIMLADTPRAALAQRLIDGGFLNAVSVGFRSMERTGGRMTKEPVRHVKQSLLEISLVTVPANSEALRLRSFTPPPTAGPEPDTKAGRVLSRANEAKLRQCVDALGMAHEMLAAVLAQVSSAGSDESAPPEPKATEPDAARPVTIEADIGAILAFLGRKE